MLAIHADTVDNNKRKETRENITRTDSMYAHIWQTSAFRGMVCKAFSQFRGSASVNERPDALPEPIP